MSSYFQRLETTVCDTYIVTENEKLIGILWSKESVMNIFPGSKSLETDLHKEVSAQLMSYMSKTLTKFDLPIHLEGTDFQKSVWRELLDIPYGETRSYLEIAEAVGSPKAMRAVGGANGRNKISIVVPCHRVIGKDGSLTGFAGGTGIKHKLLQLEA